MILWGAIVEIRAVFVRSNLRPSRKLIVGIAAFFLFSGAVFYATHSLKNSRPRYIFINQTNNHDHDLALKMSLKLAEGRSGIENSLVLLKTLPVNTSIEQTAENIFERWKIGQGRGGKGILLLYSEKENLFKIEVSYALEGIFTDILCRQLEEAAKTYMLSDVPQDFLSELLITMNIHGQDNKAELEDSFNPPMWFKSQFMSGGAGVSAKGYRRSLKEYTEAVRRLPTEDLKDFEPSSDPQEVLDRYFKSLALGLGDPQLPFLTQGSKIFRMVVPRNGAQERRVLNYYRKAMPFKLYTYESLGLCVFRPGVANLPIVLRHSRDGLWYIDEPKSWTYFHRFENANDFYPKYDDLPFLQDLILAGQPNARQPVYRQRVSTPRVISYPFSLVEYIEDLDRKIKSNPSNDKAYAELGEVYLFETGWIKKALELFEKASFLNPQKIEYRWRLYDLYVNNSQIEKALDELKFLARTLPNDEEVKRWYVFYSQAYHFKPGEFD